MPCLFRTLVGSLTACGRHCGNIFDRARFSRSEGLRPRCSVVHRHVSRTIWGNEYSRLGRRRAHLAFKVDRSRACKEAFVVCLLHRRRYVGTHHVGGSSERPVGAHVWCLCYCESLRLGSRVCSAPMTLAAAIETFRCRRLSSPAPLLASSIRHSLVDLYPKADCHLPATF